MPLPSCRENLWMQPASVVGRPVQKTLSLPGGDKAPGSPLRRNDGHAPEKECCESYGEAIWDRQGRNQGQKRGSQRDLGKREEDESTATSCSIILFKPAAPLLL